MIGDWNLPIQWRKHNFFRIRLLNFIFTTPIIRYKLIHLKRVQTITNKSYISGHFCYTPEEGSNVILDNNNAGCPIAFHRIGDKCYFYGYFKLNWFRAMEFCHSFGSSVSLACIESPQENDYLKNWLIEYGKYSVFA